MNMAEPFTWLFLCFFQPARFEREYGAERLSRRGVSMLKAVLPLFLCTYPLALGVHILLFYLLQTQHFFCSPAGSPCEPSLNIGYFFGGTAIATLLGILIGSIAGMLGGRSFGILFGGALGIALGGVLGMVLSFVWGSSVFSFASSRFLSIALGGAFGIVLGICLSIGAGTALGDAAGRGVGTWIILPFLFGVSALVGALIAIHGTANGTFDLTFVLEAVVAGVAIWFLIVLAYPFGRSRLLLYPVSAYSGIRAYLASRRQPGQVFIKLRRSALYWDERVASSLPGLRGMLLIAAEQNVERTLEEIGFILAERPKQLEAARAVSLEIAIRDLEQRGSMRDIARAAQRLSELLPREANLLDPRWVAPFARLSDASRDATSFNSPLGWKARRKALEDMLTNLDKVHPNTAFSDPRLNKRLGEVVNRWQRAARQELDSMEEGADLGSRIDNPYHPGLILKLGDSLFVGRLDLVQQLEEALSKGDNRPTFLLNGERRMGKSSTLMQLPRMLGSHYLPITFDLQRRSLSSSTAAFLSTISQEVAELMNTRSLPARALEFERLRDAGRENEAAIYRLFDDWLREIERTLEREDRTLLLIFDEFEKLEEAGRDGYLNLNLLLDWFRTVIQHRPRLALLFSGVQTFGEMGASWAGYFVNAKILRVSFLRPKEAQQLITKPTPNFPSEEIFGEGVVEEIIRVTGGHPFLIQASCSEIIETLNTEGRTRAEQPDVARAVEQVLEKWGDTYLRDLWERTNQDQRACLMALRAQGTGGPEQMAERSGLDEKQVRRALQDLLRRDLVVREQEQYRIATPIFSEWVAYSNV